MPCGRNDVAELSMPLRSDRSGFRVRSSIGCLAIVAALIPACSGGELSCLELEAEAIIAAQEYDAAEVGSNEEAEARDRFDQLVGQQIDLEC